jgi:hypothetical protein
VPVIVREMIKIHHIRLVRGKCLRTLKLVTFVSKINKDSQSKRKDDEFYNIS